MLGSMRHVLLALCGWHVINFLDSPNDPGEALFPGAPPPLEQWCSETWDEQNCNGGALLPSLVSCQAALLLMRQAAVHKGVS
jgi:hypothetical protein